MDSPFSFLVTYQLCLYSCLSCYRDVILANKLLIRSYSSLSPWPAGTCR